MICSSGSPRPLPLVLALEQACSSYRRRRPVLLHAAPGALSAGLRRAGSCAFRISAEPHRPRCIDLRHLFDLCRIVEQAVLDSAVSATSPASTTPVWRYSDRVRILFRKPWRNEPEQLHGIGSRPAELDLHAAAREILLPEKDNDPCCRKLVSPRLDAGIFQVL